MSQKTKNLINDLKADVIAAKEDHAKMEKTVLKLLERQQQNNERIDRKIQVLCDEMEKRCEVKSKNDA